MSAAYYDYTSGMYLGIGKCRYQHGPATVQYIGLSSRLSTRLNGRHHKLAKITREAKLWLGEVATAEVPGKKVKKTSAILDSAEWLHAFFLKLPLNEKKTMRPPQKPCTVLNRWWKKDYATPWVKRPHANWPDFIDYLGPNMPARLVWFGKRQKRVNPPFVVE